MKATAAYFMAAVLSANQVHAECFDGTIAVISPGYTVVHKCNVYRQGEITNNVVSALECAILAKNAGVSVSTYHPPTKRCIVASEDGKDISRDGTTYMKRIFGIEEADPFAVELVEEEDPFLDCEGEKANCRIREANLKVDLATVQAQLVVSEAESAIGKADSALLKDMLASNCPSQHTLYGVVGGTEYRFWCGRHHSPAGEREVHKNVNTFEACAKLCNARSWCVFAQHGIHKTVCHLYDRKTSHTTQPELSDGYWNCAVKK
ncbi:hypothetical protein NW762_003761 [Fusarium torreyae]|uniref:Apple domain-containing protein n=1 Tax=Fusarium torreyae TaxID=1237075 RepID=A0A9W8VLY8_9HYPO|nr:hypothetical protein NW762_003761 [Fusarium torreyae]